MVTLVIQQAYGCFLKLLRHCMII